jgi:hypothetical protein
MPTAAVMAAVEPAAFRTRRRLIDERNPGVLALKAMDQSSHSWGLGRPVLMERLMLFDAFSVNKKDATRLVFHQFHRARRGNLGRRAFFCYRSRKGMPDF